MSRTCGASTFMCAHCGPVDVMGPVEACPRCIRRGAQPYRHLHDEEAQRTRDHVVELLAEVVLFTVGADLADPEQRAELQRGLDQVSRELRR